MMVYPEIILLNTLRNALKFVRDDYAQQTDKTKSYLYKLLNGAQLERYNMYDQAKTIICGTADSPRLFEIDLMFNNKREGVPTAHITLPSEQQTQQNSLGMGIGEDYIIDDGDDVNDVPGSVTDVLSRRLQATYNIVITSDNPNEVILLYHFTRALLIACFFTLNENDIYNVTFGGRDIEPYSEVFQNLYMRAIQISLQYKTYVPSMYSQPMAHDAVASGTPVNQLSVG